METAQQHLQARAAEAGAQETQQALPTEQTAATAVDTAQVAAVVEQRPMERPQATAAMDRQASSLSRLISKL
jgi:hypothetical protein